MSVYDPANFKGRVDLAAAYISKSRRTNRTFDTCFEMGDADAVVMALVRRATARPQGRLAHNLSRYIAQTSIDRARATL